MYRNNKEKNIYSYPNAMADNKIKITVKPIKLKRVLFSFIFNLCELYIFIHWQFYLYSNTRVFTISNFIFLLMKILIEGNVLAKIMS